MNALKQEFEYLCDDFCDYMRRDTRGAEVIKSINDIIYQNINKLYNFFQIMIYGTSSLLLAVAYHKIRPVSDFTVLLIKYKLLLIDFQVQ